MEVNNTNNNQDRNKLFNNFWKLANKLRGKNASPIEFSDYIFTFLFYRFLSEHLVYKLKENDKQDGHDNDYDYSQETDENANEYKENIIRITGFFIKPSHLFSNLIKDAKNNANLNEQLSQIFQTIERDSVTSKGDKPLDKLFTSLSLENTKIGLSVSERNRRFVEILFAINDLDIKLDNMDMFGELYQFLMEEFAKGIKKGGGEFFTPPEVSQLLINLTTINKEKKSIEVYDPACGTGSLLLKFQSNPNINVEAFYGQEVNIATYNLCRMNMFLHNIVYDKFKIAHGDTLLNPQHDQKQFDVIVSNPPYSISWNVDENPQLQNDERFSPAGALAPKSKADLAFAMHILYHLKNNGKAAIVSFPGTLYRKGPEQNIRKYLTEQALEAVIHLPGNIFFGASIETCIIVLNKGRVDDKVLFIDARDQFQKLPKLNKIGDENIEFITSIFKDKKEIQYRSKLVSIDEIIQNDYNLSVSKYVEQKPEEEIDINALNQEISELVLKEQEYRNTIDLLIKKIEENEF